jgi:UDPglucose--hexose-1-phosphate uridylyltransferase
MILQMFEGSPHRRFNPLTGEWLLVSPHRTQRPWQGQVEAVASEQRPTYDPNCYLCPGNKRAGAAQNPRYDGTFVFDNDFPALLPGEGTDVSTGDPLFRAEPTYGTCRVVCFSPRHDLTLAEMDVDAIARVIDTWAAETTALGERWRWVQVFENKGAAMGCSNPHPHGQIWASDALPSEAAAEDRQQRNYLRAYDSVLLEDYARREADKRVRVVCENDAFLAVVPFWATWPFETLVLPRRRVARLPDLAPGERRALAELLRVLLGACDRLFGVSFPYSMGWHGAPFDARPQPESPPVSNEHWQLHGHVYPPLLRSATIRKFMVGYEMLGEPQRDLTPEAAAERLRAMVG